MSLFSFLELSIKKNVIFKKVLIKNSNNRKKRVCLYIYLCAHTAIQGSSGGRRHRAHQAAHPRAHLQRARRAARLPLLRRAHRPLQHHRRHAPLNCHR